MYRCQTSAFSRCPCRCRATDVIETLVTGESKLTDVVGEIGEIGKVGEGLEEDELGLPWALHTK